MTDTSKTASPRGGPCVNCRTTYTRIINSGEKFETSECPLCGAISTFSWGSNANDEGEVINEQ